MGNKPATPQGSVHDFKVTDIKNNECDMAQYQGKVLLIVNTASKCGFTPQYKGLEELYKEYKDKNVEIIGFPCNQFGSQEPGNEDDIVTFCERNYGVTFPLMKKIDVNGKDEAPIYTYLKGSQGGLWSNDIKWNFTKFLVDTNGKPVDRYASFTTPEKIKKDIDKLLASMQKDEQKVPAEEEALVAAQRDGAQGDAAPVDAAEEAKKEEVDEAKEEAGDNKPAEESKNVNQEEDKPEPEAASVEEATPAEEEAAPAAAPAGDGEDAAADKEANAGGDAADDKLKES